MSDSEHGGAAPLTGHGSIEETIKRLGAMADDPGETVSFLEFDTDSEVIVELPERTKGAETKEGDDE